MVECKVLDEFIAEIKKYGVTRAAYASGISQATLWKWVGKQAVPTLVNAQVVANAIGFEFLLFDKLEDDV